MIPAAHRQPATSASQGLRVDFISDHFQKQIAAGFSRSRPDQVSFLSSVLARGLRAPLIEMDSGNRSPAKFATIKCSVIFTIVVYVAAFSASQRLILVQKGALFVSPERSIIADRQSRWTNDVPAPPRKLNGVISRSCNTHGLEHIRVPAFPSPRGTFGITFGLFAST